MLANQEFSCRIPHHKVINKKIVYVVIFVSHSYCSAKVQHLRYSDAEKLHNKIDKQLQQLRQTVNLPSFPGKKLFGSHNDSESGILRRRSDLQDYFNQLLKIEKLYSLSCLKQLLPDINDDKSDLVQYLEERPLQQYNFIIDSYQQLDMFVLYFVQVIDNFNKSKWRFKTRYSDLRDIHQALKEQTKITLPEFPKRKIFGITNDDPQEIETRKCNLETYLNSLYAHPELNNSEILDYFIQNSRRESKKLQKYDEQKILLKMKLKQKQQKEKQIEQLQQKLLQNNENSKNEINTNDKSRNNSIKRLPRKGLFTIKEQLDKYEDDNTTLIRYSSIPSNPLNQIGQMLISKESDQDYEKANSEPETNNQDMEYEQLDENVEIQNQVQQKIQE
ncbi:unnamed protein product [Paramecium pentaurelia]|uniref:PX domain-containing protein n=1 Tax=Paramecium pentaurelia TaxID=43138 RepID=A0A8S1XX67_9CILI|nr:unnamed protein product [Paramecium pentaurelia]